jgi:hypothetical protein
MRQDDVATATRRLLQDGAATKLAV